MIKVNERVFYLIILCAGIIGMKALFHPGFYTSHDGTHQVVRLMHFVQGLKDGQFPVRWAGTALAGYGYPLFIFTYRVPFYSAIGWYTVFRSLTGAIKFSFILSYLLSGWAMYALVKSIWKNRSAALLSSLVYLWAPYRFEVILVRAALGEAWIFVFLPLVFLGMYQIRRMKKSAWRWIVLTALGSYGMVGSHAMLSYMAIPFLAGWWGLLFFQHAKRQIYIRHTLATLVLFLAVSAFYLFPALTEKKYVQFDQNIGNYFVNHFVTLKQLWYSRWGYGFSMPGTGQDEMSFQVGFGIWLVITATIGLTLYLAYKRQVGGLKNYRIVLFFLTAFMISIVMMLSVSEPVYRMVNRFMAIDIPWRFLTFTTFTGSILTAFIWQKLPHPMMRWGWLAALLFFISYGNRNHLNVNQYTYPKDQDYWQNTESSNEHDEYRPKTFTLSNYDQQDPDISFIQGSGQVVINEKQSNRVKLAADISSEKADMVYKLAYYPGWEVRIDGQKMPITLTDGKITLLLKVGQQKIDLFYRDTVFRQVCNFLSLASILFIIGLIILCQYRKNQR